MLQNYLGRLKTKQSLAEDIYRLEFELENPQTLTFIPGQYLLLDINGGYRQYSVSSSPNQTNILEIIIDAKPMGLGSKYLLKLSTNDHVSFRAPMGMFTLKNNPRPKVFLATGAGIAPIKSMILNLSETGFSKNFILLWGLKNKTDLYLTQLWQQIHETSPNFSYYYCLSQEHVNNEFCFDGRIQSKLATMEPNLSGTDFYLCGRQLTVDSIKEFLVQKLHINPQNIYHEKFT